ARPRVGVRGADGNVLVRCGKGPGYGCARHDNGSGPSHCRKGVLPWRAGWAGPTGIPAIGHWWRPGGRSRACPAGVGRGSSRGSSSARRRASGAGPREGGPGAGRDAGTVSAGPGVDAPLHRGRRVRWAARSRPGHAGRPGAWPPPRVRDPSNDTDRRARVLGHQDLLALRLVSVPDVDAEPEVRRGRAAQPTAGVVLTIALKEVLVEP